MFSCFWYLPCTIIAVIGALTWYNTIDISLYCTTTEYIYSSSLFTSSNTSLEGRFALYSFTNSSFKYLNSWFGSLDKRLVLLRKFSRLVLSKTTPCKVAPGSRLYVQDKVTLVLLIPSTTMVGLSGSCSHLKAPLIKSHEINWSTN